MPYRVEISSSNRAACKGPKPCSGTKIQKGEIRFGTVVEIQGNTSFQWRHFECITPKQVANLKADLGSMSELDGYEDLPKSDQTRFDRLWEEGKVSEDEAMSRGHDPLDNLSVGELRSLAKDRELEFKGLSKEDLVKLVRADIGGARPEKIVHDPLEDMPAADLKEKLGALDLPKTGAKAVLVARLREALGPMTGEEDADKDACGPSVGVKDEGAGERKPAAGGKGKPAKAKAGAAGKRKRVKDESSAEESSAAESSSAASSSDDEPSAESSEEEESDVKPSSKNKRGGKSASSTKKGKGKAAAPPAKKGRKPKEASSDEDDEDVKPRVSGRPSRSAGRAGRKSLAESATEEEEDVKPRVGGRGGKTAPKAPPKPAFSEEEDEPSPPKKKKRTVKAEAESDDE